MVSLVVVMWQASERSDKLRVVVSTVQQGRESGMRDVLGVHCTHIFLVLSHEW